MNLCQGGLAATPPLPVYLAGRSDLGVEEAIGACYPGDSWIADFQRSLSKPGMHVSAHLAFQNRSCEWGSGGSSEPPPFQFEQSL
jgi:hypothetical protein